MGYRTFVFRFVMVISVMSGVATREVLAFWLPLKNKKVYGTEEWRTKIIHGGNLYRRFVKEVGTYPELSDQKELVRDIKYKSYVIDIIEKHMLAGQWTHNDVEEYHNLIRLMLAALAPILYERGIGLFFTILKFLGDQYRGYIIDDPFLYAVYTHINENPESIPCVIEDLSHLRTFWEILFSGFALIERALDSEKLTHTDRASGALHRNFEDTLKRYAQLTGDTTDGHTWFSVSELLQYFMHASIGKIRSKDKARSWENRMRELRTCQEHIGAPLNAVLDELEKR